MSRTMKAAVVRAFGQPLTIEEVAVPEPGPGQIQVGLGHKLLPPQRIHPIQFELALSQRGLQIFRDILGHQYACRQHPRRASERDQLTPRQQEALALAGAPARRGHKPNRHTLRDHFAAQGVAEQDVKADVDVLVRMGLLVELENGQLDALGPGSHIAT